jgi:hypothetical protein
MICTYVVVVSRLGIGLHSSGNAVRSYTLIEFILCSPKLLTNVSSHWRWANEGWLVSFTNIAVTVATAP